MKPGDVVEFQTRNTIKEGENEFIKNFKCRFLLKAWSLKTSMMLKNPGRQVMGLLTITTLINLM